MEIQDVILISWIWLGFSIFVFIYDRKMIEHIGIINTNSIPFLISNNEKV